MSEINDRYRRIAAQFSQRVDAVAPGDWDNPAPPEGWVARDVVGHLDEWLSSFFFGNWEIEASSEPTAQEDPVGAWHRLDQSLQAALDDTAIATAERDLPMGTMTFEQALDMICTNDILLHTWDLARATGLDETLDPAEVSTLLVSMEPMDERLRTSGHYGPRVAVPDDADDQTKLIAFIGRQP